MAIPSFPVCCPTPFTATIFEDSRGYGATGVAEIGLWEYELTGAGFDGWCDVEVLSGNEPSGDAGLNPVWSRPAAEVARGSVTKVLHLWNTMDRTA